MKTHRLALFAVVALVASHALAQTPGTPAPAARPAAPPAVTSAPPPPPPAPAPPAPRKEGQPINIRVETTISESGGNAPPVKKAVTAVAGDGFDASVREIATPPVGPSLNVDASPTILSNGKIRVRVTLQYAAGQSQPAEQRVRTDIRQTLVLNLENGKPLVISEASDPLSDRRVTVEVTATILK
jgi:hypothetical protein